MFSRKPKQKKTKHRNGLIEIANGMLTLLVIGIVAAGGLFLYAANQFYSSSTVKQDTAFLVEEGSGLSGVAQRLETQGMISNRYLFQAGGMALKKQGQLKAGEFRIAAGSSMADILKELTEGKPVQYGVTVPEGFTVWQVVQRLNEDARLIGELRSIPVEGSILPNTYNYTPGDDRQAILDQMTKAMSEEVAQVWANRDPDLPIKTPEELVTLASIVEKETGIASERGEVASVFINRLKADMRLQSDPTIIYGITKGQKPLGRGLLRSEIEQETPYNTYKIDGLPPTPIANPGIESLRAVANPASSENLYFVAKGPVPSDGHVFAKTYDEHRKNVARWREIEREAAAQAERDAEAARESLEAEEAEQAGDASSPVQQ